MDNCFKSGYYFGFVVGNFIGGGIVVEELSRCILDSDVFADVEILEKESSDPFNFFFEDLLLWTSHWLDSSVIP